MGTLKLIFDFKFPLPPSLFVIKKEPERGAAAAADYKLEIHILATFKETFALCDLKLRPGSRPR